MVDLKAHAGEGGDVFKAVEDGGGGQEGNGKNQPRRITKRRENSGRGMPPPDRRDGQGSQAEGYMDEQPNGSADPKECGMKEAGNEE